MGRPSRPLLGPDARAAQRLAEARHLVSMLPGAAILHVESVQERTPAGTRATVRLDRTRERREAWFSRLPVRPGQSVVCLAFGHRTSRSEPDVLTIDGQDPPDSCYLLHAGTERRAGRWYARHPEVPEHARGGRRAGQPP